MTRYICKLCNKEIKNAFVSEIVTHSATHTKKLELPSKALEHFRIEQS